MAPPIIWHRVRHDYDQAKQRAPAGFEPLVTVSLVGRPEPIVLGFVESRRDGDPWIRFESEVKHADGDKLADTDPIPSECYWIHAPESAIVSIEVSYRKIVDGKAIGFAVVERDDLPTTDEP